MTFEDAAAHWVAGERGPDPAARLQDLLTRYVGEDGIDVAGFLEKTGVAARHALSNARLASSAARTAVEDIDAFIAWEPDRAADRAFYQQRASRLAHAVELLNQAER